MSFDADDQENDILWQNSPINRPNRCGRAVILARSGEVISPESQYFRRNLSTNVYIQEGLWYLDNAWKLLHFA